MLEILYPVEAAVPLGYKRGSLRERRAKMQRNEVGYGECNDEIR